jgi:hypothetical protein
MMRKPRGREEEARCVGNKIVGNDFPRGGVVYADLVILDDAPDGVVFLGQGTIVAHRVRWKNSGNEMEPH